MTDLLWGFVFMQMAMGAFDSRHHHEFTQRLALGGQRMMPRAALASGFDFDYPTLDEALGAIVGNPSAASLSRKWSTLSLRSPLR